MRNSIVFLVKHCFLCFIVISCASNNNEASDSPINEFNYEHFTIRLDSSLWEEFLVERNITSFKKKEETHHNYQFNFTGVLLYEGNDAIDYDIESILEDNFSELSNIYFGTKIISSNKLDSHYEGCYLSFAAYTKDEISIGVMIYVFRAGNKIYMFSFQADNQKGAFKNKIEEIESIVSQIILH